jgi:hypothetical protein
LHQDNTCPFCFNTSVGGLHGCGQCNYNYTNWTNVICNQPTSTSYFVKLAIPYSCHDSA